jgi:hypothetical protein
MSDSKSGRARGSVMRCVGMIMAVHGMVVIVRMKVLDHHWPLRPVVQLCDESL